VNLTLSQTAKLLKISSATVKNWLRAGVLESTDVLHIRETKKNIESGILKRLQKGANKHQSRKLHTHTELLSNAENAEALKPLTEKFFKEKKELLLAVYLRQLVEAKLAGYKNKKFILNNKLKKELQAWDLDLNSAFVHQIYNSVSASQADFSDNLLSYLHQSLNQTSSKQDLGAYYTPVSAVKIALSCIKQKAEICDPCCGSGNFLVEAYQKIKKLGWPSAENYIFGYDCDPLAVLIARANLTLASENKIDVVSAVQKRDFLQNRPMEEFGYIVTNPPWGSYAKKTQTAKLQKKFGLAKTKDSFSFFLAASLQTMKHNGSGAFILPVSFMNVAAHAEIRRFLFSNCTVTEIKLLPEKFSGVMTSSVLVNVKNCKPALNHEIVITSESSCRVRNVDLLKTKAAILPLNNDKESLSVINEIESCGVKTLRGQSLWGLGLVTGNNEKYLFESAAKGRAPVITGGQVFRFKQPEAGTFCASDISQFQQAAPVEVYRAAKKLVYRFIAKELVFAIDTKKLFTLNSANILIPTGDNYSCEFLCGLFNSRLAQYYFSKKYSSIKVLRSHLESFPLPAFNQKLFAQIETCVLQLQNGYDRQLANELDESILKAYGLSKKSSDSIMSYRINEAFN
jgi:predicted RNA methylase/predicted transcriptional regulator